MANVAAFLVLLLAIPAAYADQYVVGDNAGWTNFGVNYDTWSSGKTFKVDDTLVFNYDTSTHTLAEVSKSDYESCASSNAIQTYRDGATKIELKKVGTMYFICPTAGHCSNGMKLAVNVVSDDNNTPSGSPTTPSTPSGSTTPTNNTPSTNTPTTTTNSPSDNGASSTWGARNLALGLLLVAGASVALMG